MSDEQRIPIKFLHAVERARPLCPDHRDKASGYNCLLCEIERLRADLDELQHAVDMYRCDGMCEHAAGKCGALCPWCEIDRLSRWVCDLQAGMYINCVYCGHRYGPDDAVAATMQDALYEHIAVCPKHPLSKANAEIEQLKSELAEASNGQHPPWDTTQMISRMQAKIEQLQQDLSVVTKSRDHYMAEFNRFDKGYWEVVADRNAARETARALFTELIDVQSRSDDSIGIPHRINALAWLAEEAIAWLTAMNDEELTSFVESLPL